MENKRYGATPEEIKKFCAEFRPRYGATDDEIASFCFGKKQM